MELSWSRQSQDDRSKVVRPTLDEMVVIVTGSAQGIGASIAERVLRRGAALMLCDKQADKVSEVATHLAARWSGEVASCYVDICDDASVAALVERTLERFGRVDALVCNAGIDAPPVGVFDVDAEHWRRLIDVNLSGAWWCAQAVLEPMRLRGAGKIVFISSLAARVGSERYSPAYAAAKAGLLGLTVGMALQLEAHGILVNAITPGATGSTGTPMTPEERAALLGEFPLGLVGPDPVAEAVCYLLDSSGDWISGAVLNVSGGQLRGI